MSISPSSGLLHVYHTGMRQVTLLIILLPVFAACQRAADPNTIEPVKLRIATFNIAMGLEEEGRQARNQHSSLMIFNGKKRAMWRYSRYWLPLIHRFIFQRSDLPLLTILQE